MKICVLGTHGTGKTTIVDTAYDKIINDPLILTNIAKINEMYSEVCKLIGQKSGANFKTQEEITLATYYRQMAIENIYNINKQDYICDRSPFDCFVYANKFSPNCQYAFLQTVARQYCDIYDKIYLIEPSDRPIEDNGFRNINKEDQMNIHKIFIKEMGYMDNVVLVNQEEQENIIDEIISLF